MNNILTKGYSLPYTLNKEIRYSIPSDNPSFYKLGKLQYGTYKGYSEKAKAYITFEVHQKYWSGDQYSNSGMYDTEDILWTEPALDQSITWNAHLYILPITNCILIEDPNELHSHR